MSGDPWRDSHSSTEAPPEFQLGAGHSLATVEPVFGNLCANKRLDRFTLRGRAKVDGQWKLFCLVQNIEKLAHAGYAA